jgi:methylenetetrahydrofolate dehydrogenase (NADP+)/methenyltetrahydrofolate cyclohydrolase
LCFLNSKRLWEIFSMTRIDGKQVAARAFERLEKQTAQLQKEHGITAGLAVVIIGDDPASQVYVRNKVKRATALGMHSVKHELPKEASQEEVLRLVKKLNGESNIHGILVQSPPPPQIDERAIIEAINPAKDVDCFHPYNVGKLLIGDNDGFLPCTPQGVMELIKYYEIETSGKHAVIIGRSNIVGKPMSVLLSRKAPYANCTVTMCHSRTRDIPSITRQADILIAAIGKPNFVKSGMVKENAVVIDVGINRVDAPGTEKGYRLAGDVDFDEVAPKSSYITPVPGGVGAMTIAMLLVNTVKACCMQNGISLE